MATAREWFAGSRPRTLPAAIAPVLVGTGAAAFAEAAHLGRAALAAGVALALQVAVHFANDYSDRVRGTDLDRLGPTRLTASGGARPRRVLVAALVSFAVAAVFGITLVALTGAWWLLAIGALAIGAAWFYTGGRKPYGYLGLGEVGVFVFFGLVATIGTTYTQVLAVPWPAWVAAVGVGLNACALLMANNLRDVPTDSLAGKRTLAVRLGGVVCAIAAPWALLVLLLALPLTLLSLTVLAGARGRLLVPVLAGTGMLALGYGVLLGLGLAL